MALAMADNSLAESSGGNVSSSSDMLKHVAKLCVSYSASSLVGRTLQRLTPVLQWLESYHACVQIYLQAAPAPFVIFWGTLSLVIEVSYTRESRLIYLGT